MKILGCIIYLLYVLKRKIVAKFLDKDDLRQL